jgi:hypothetical protein
VKGRFEPLVSGAEGKLVRRVRANRSNLDLKALVRYGDDFNREDAAQGVTRAVFPDGTICTVEVRVGNSDVKYRLKLRDRRGTFEERRGSCDTAGIPDVNGTVDVMHDGDGDPGTPNVTLLTGDF